MSATPTRRATTRRVSSRKRSGSGTSCENASPRPKRSAISIRNPSERNPMKRIASLALCAMLAAAGLALGAEPLKLAGRTELPEYSGDFDHFAVDLRGNRLFLAGEDGGTLEVLDLK